VTATTHFAPTPQKLSGRSLVSTPVISVTALAGVPAFVRHAFGEKVLNQVNQAVMLDIEAIEDQDCFIPHVTMTVFVNAVSRLSREEHFGVMLAPYLSLSNYGCWGEYVLAAPTLLAAINRAGATIGFHSKGESLTLFFGDGHARLRYASAAKGQDGYPHVACGAAGVMVSLCRSFLPATWRPRRIELDIARPDRPSVFEDAFDCPVRFNAEHIEVWLDPSCLGAKSPRHGPTALITVDDLARARVECPKLNGLKDVIAQQVWAQVLAGQASIESAARSLDTSVRTLQRELNREGTDFRSIANAMRSRRAVELLRNSGATVTTIAAALGYSAPAHFARAFRKATGLSPAEFRQRSAPASAT